MKVGLGEFIYIVILFTIYGLGANIQSRLYPVNSSMATTVRVQVMLKIGKIIAEGERKDCEETALRFRNSQSSVIWYYNNETNEYWCGLVAPNKLTLDRARELRPYSTIMNSDKYIRRKLSESNKYNSR